MLVEYKIVGANERDEGHLDGFLVKEGHTATEAIYILY